MTALSQSSVLDSLPAQLAVLDGEGVVVLVNEAWRAFAERGGDRRSYQGANFFTVCEHAYGVAATEARVAAEGVRLVLGGSMPVFTMDVRCDAPEGVRWFALQAVPFAGATGGAVLTYTDITVRKEAEEVARHRATHDVLTGLPNRVLILDRLRHASLAGRRDGSSVGVLFIDVDRLKSINDVHGHAVGDEVLHEVARRLRSCVRPHDTVGRLAGDEFVVVCSPPCSVDVAAAVAARIHHVMTEPVLIVGRQLVVGLSVGVHVSDRWHDAPADLLHLADTAMFREKAARRARAARADAVPARGCSVDELETDDAADDPGDQQQPDH